MTARNWLRSRRHLSRWLLVLGWMGVIFYLSAQPDLPHPASGWADWAFSSGAHAFVFGVLAVLVGWALDGQPHALILAFCAAVLYGLSDEFHQSFVPGRTPDPVDLGCDATGALVGLWLWTQARRRLKN